LAVVSLLYFRRKCTRAEAVLLFFSITLGLSGLSVQYLCWVLPLAVLCRRPIFLALYTVASGGNLIIPLLLLGFAAIEIVRKLPESPASRGRDVETGRKGADLRLLAPAVVAALLLLLAATWAGSREAMESGAFVGRIEARIGEYDVVRYRGSGIRAGTKVWLARSLREAGVAHPIANLTTIALVWVIVSALAAGLGALRVSSAADERRAAA
jgi:hypothetical protein